jgi:hypothetical protein
MLAGTCVQYARFVGTPTVTLDEVSYDSACPVEIDVFARGLGAYARTIDPGQPGDEDWLLQAIETGGLTIGLNVPTRVPLRLWLVAAAGDQARVRSLRDELLDKAYPVLDHFGTGLWLDTASAELAPIALDPDCDKAGAISTNSSIYDAARINVYFVKAYLDIKDLTPAMNCWIEGHPGVVFISWSYANMERPTLAHEIGHALGLIHPESLGGHTYEEEGFDRYNFMATGSDVTNVSIGQLYAMNFSSDSWLNRSGSSFVRPVVRTCQDTWDTGTCPELKLFQPGWPPP